MADIEYGSQFAQGLSSNATTSWADIVNEPSTSFVDDGVYLVIATAQVQGSDANKVFDFRVEAGGNQVGDSLHMFEPKFGVSTSLDGYAWYGIFTQAATKTDLSVQFKAPESATAYARNTTLFWMQLDASLTSDQYKYYEHTTGTAHNTTLTDRGTGLIWTPATAGNDWLILCQASFTVDNVASQIEMDALGVDGTNGSSPYGQGVLRRLGKDTTETLSLTRMWVAESLSAASHTMKIQTRDRIADADHNEYISSSVIAIDLDAFESHAVAKQAAEDDGETTYVTLVTSTYSPTTVTADQVVLTDVVTKHASNARESYTQTTYDSTPSPGDWEGYKNNQAQHNLDEKNAPLIDVVSFDGSTVIDVDAKVDSTTGTPVVDDAVIAAWSVKLAGGVDDSASPAAVAGSSEVPAPTVTWGGAATPSAVAAAGEVPAPTVTVADSATPSPVAAAGEVPSPVATAADATATPGPTAAAGEVPAPTVTVDDSATPGAVSAAGEVPAATAAESVAPAPSAVAATGEVPAPTAVESVATAPGAVAAAGEVPAATAAESVTPTPTAVAAAGEVPSPTVVVDDSAAPSPVAAAGAVPAPTATESVAPAPAAIAATGEVPAPTATESVAASPAAVVAAGEVPAPTALESVTVTPAPVAAKGEVPQPLAGLTGPPDMEFDLESDRTVAFDLASDRTTAFVLGSDRTVAHDLESDRSAAYVLESDRTLAFSLTTAS